MAVESPWPLLEKRFPSGEYALLQEVRDKAGFYASRAADGIAFNLWPSRGLEIEGIEVKSYRSDWLAELKKPEKAENIFKYCDRWWLVAAAEDVVKIEEVPKTWGLMVVVKGKLKVLKEAPKLNPEPLDRHFVAALLKRATKGMIPAESISDKLEAARRDAEDRAKNNQPWELDQAQKNLKELKDKVKTFEETSGLEITGWKYNPKKIGAAVKFINEGGMPSLHKDLLNLKRAAEYICKKVSEGLESAEIFEKEQIDDE